MWTSRVPAIDAHALHLFLRWSHVAAMATALGGALLVTAVVWRRDRHGSLAVAVAYERLFWAAAGVLVMTGVGNLARSAAHCRSRRPSGDRRSP